MMSTNKDTATTPSVGWTWKSSGHFNADDYIYSFSDKFFKFITWSTLTAILKKVAYESHDLLFFVLFGVGFLCISTWLTTSLVNVIFNRLIIPFNDKAAFVITIVVMVFLSAIASLAVQNGLESVFDKITVLQRPK